jgi:hypothetical protein
LRYESATRYAVIRSFAEETTVAKPEGPEAIMSPAQLKPLLALSKTEPVSCAAGLTKDKQGVILLDKKAKPRSVMSQLKKAAAAVKLDLDPTTLCFGTASVDAETDPGLVSFRVNKEPPSAVRPKLVEQLKKAGFSKCEFTVDPSLEADPEDAATAADPQPAAAAAPAAPPGPAAPPSPATLDSAGLSARLSGLVKQLMALMPSKPPGADAMKTAAQGAQASLKSGDLAAASQQADALARMLAAASKQQPPAAASSADSPAPATAAPASPTPASPTPAPAPASPVLAKARMTWVATRKKIEGELEKLHAELTSVYKGHGVAADLDKAFRAKVEPIMTSLDESLTQKLDEVSSSTDPAAHAKLVQEARQIIVGYEHYLAGEKLIAKLDANPFVPLTIEKTLTASLGVLSKAVA